MITQLGVAAVRGRMQYSAMLTYCWDLASRSVVWHADSGSVKSVNPSVDKLTVGRALSGADLVSCISGRTQALKMRSRLAARLAGGSACTAPAALSRRDLTC